MYPDRYVVDGAVRPDDPDGPEFQGDGQFAPFVIFDIEAQENLPGHFASRAEAEQEMHRRFGTH